MSPEPIDITVELDTHIQLATLSLRRQVLRSVIITNHGDDAISGLELELESDPGLIHAKTIRIMAGGTPPTRISGRVCYAEPPCPERVFERDARGAS